jgi:beta-glucanase (GH16 family)
LGPALTVLQPEQQLVVSNLINTSHRPARSITISLARLAIGTLSLSCGLREGAIGPAPTHDAGAKADARASGGGLGGAPAHDAGATISGTGGATGAGGATGGGGARGTGGATGATAAGGARDAGTTGGAAGAPARDGGVSVGTGGATVPDAGTVSGYTMVFSDEFNGTSLDRTKWCTRYVYGGGAPLQIPDTGCTGPDGFAGTLDFLNDEQQRYVDTNTKGEAMHVESAGTLKMRATKTRTDTYASYESSMIRSKVQFKPSATTSYYILSRVRLPNVKGTWPAMWFSCGFGATSQIMWPPEVDIFEGALNMVEDNPNMIRMGSQVKGGKQTSTGAMDITYSSPTYDRTWNNYFAPAPDTLRGVWVNIGATWSANAVCYYVNGLQTMCENYHWTDDAGNPANTASLLLNLAIGGAWAGRHGIDDVSFPATFEADYVHVYSFAGLTPPGTLPQ